MSIIPQDPDSNKTPPPCTTIGCTERGTIYGVFDDGDTQSETHYCPECAGYLYDWFTPLYSIPRPNLGDLIYTAWTGQDHWGGCDQREAVERVIDALHAHGFVGNA